MTERVLYEKIGKKYYPVKSCFEPIGWPAGSYLVTVGKDCATTRTVVSGDYLSVLAAVQEFRHELATFICKNSALTTDGRSLYDLLPQKVKKDISVINFPSAYMIVDKIEDFFNEKVADLARSVGFERRTIESNSHG